MKIICLIAIAIISLTAHAQTIDKALLNGKWNLYAVTVLGTRLCRDSADTNVKEVLKKVAAEDTSVVHMSRADSLASVAVVKKTFAHMFESYMKFDARGNVERLITMDEKKSKTTKQKGKFIWIGDNMISEKFDGEEGIFFIVLELTDRRLTLGSSDSDSQDTGQRLTFTRE